MCQPLITYKNAEIEYKDKIILAIDIMLYNVLMILKIYTDGGSKGNPGPSSIGGVFYLDQKKVFDFKKSEFTWFNVVIIVASFNKPIFGSSLPPINPSKPGGGASADTKLTNKKMIPNNNIFLILYLLS